MHIIVHPILGFYLFLFDTTGILFLATLKFEIKLSLCMYCIKSSNDTSNNLRANCLLVERQN